MTLPRYTFFLVIICCVFLQPSCTTSSRTQKPEITDEPNEMVVNRDFTEIKKRGHITAIMSNSSTSLFIYKGTTMGYEYDLVRAFADSMGLELRIKIIPSLEEGFEKLNQGGGDILAYNLTVTKERKKRIAFTHYHNLVRMVLIQRKPEDWRNMKAHEIEKLLIRNPVELIGKEVVVRNHSSYMERLRNLSEEIGGDIIIIQDDPNVETEGIIRKVADGEIDYTVAEEDIASVNLMYYPNLDINTDVSFPTQIAWGVRKNAHVMLDTLNDWILRMRKTSDYYTIYNKYYKSRRASLQRTKSEYYSEVGDKLSPYDDIIKQNAARLGWDWRLLAAQIYQESRFDEKAKSWAGAQGLMQLLPETGEKYGVQNLFDPKKNLQAGVDHLIWLEQYFQDLVYDNSERKKFILAAYNVGQGHVSDAMKLTQKYGGKAIVWSEVSTYLLNKSNSQYYEDEVVEFGYCRGEEPVDYVASIQSIYNNYKSLYPE